MAAVPTAPSCALGSLRFGIAALWDHCSCHPQPWPCSTSPAPSHPASSRAAFSLQHPPSSLQGLHFTRPHFILQVLYVLFEVLFVEGHGSNVAPLPPGPGALRLCFPAGKAPHAVNAFHMLPRSQLNGTPEVSQKHEKCIYTTLGGRCVPSRLC